MLRLTILGLGNLNPGMIIFSVELHARTDAFIWWRNETYERFADVISYFNILWGAIIEYLRFRIYGYVIYWCNAV
jgi:hypothetical protein